MIAADVNTAYVLRNVWAHNAGYADNSFPAKASAELAVPPGDLVKFSQKTDSGTCR